MVVRAIAAYELVVSAPYWRSTGWFGQRPEHLAHHGLLWALAAAAAMGEPAQDGFGLADPDDEVYRATALAGSAEALVTGSRRHFVADCYGDIKILSHRPFLDRRA